MVAEHICTSICCIAISFVNNKGQYGNVFFGYLVSFYWIYVNIVIKHLSVVSKDNFPGLVIHEYSNFVDIIGSVHTSITECTLVGSCVVILGDLYSYRQSTRFWIVSMDINESKCPVAMNVTDVGQLYLSNINISNSHGDIFQKTNGYLEFRDNVYFYRNQGAFSVTRGKVTFEEMSNVVFDNNSAVQQYLYNSVLYCNTTEIFFLGSAMFSNNSGREGGAIAGYGSILHFGENSVTTFSGNSADNGGAMCLNDNSFINIDKYLFSRKQSKILWWLSVCGGQKFMA